MNRLNFFLLNLVCVLLMIALSGCNPQVQPASPEDIQTALAETLASEPDPTIAATLKPTNIPVPSPTPYQTPTATLSPPIPGTISAAFLNLRAGPSTFFEIIHTFVEGTQITAVARTPDSKWVKVEIDFEDDPTMEGWMAVIYLELDGAPDGLPEEPFGPEQTMAGKVTDTEGNPIPEINIAFILHNDQVDLRADTISDQQGVFTAYLPEDLFGTFDVQIFSWTCDSPIVDANCQLSGYIEVEDRAFVTTPQEEEILFIFEATDMVLTGTVVDNKGDPVDRILLLAQRDDGATSVGHSDALGEFSIPIAPGTWEVFSIIYDPDYTEGKPLSVEVSDTAPEAVTIQAP